MNESESWIRSFAGSVLERKMRFFFLLWCCSRNILRNTQPLQEQDKSLFDEVRLKEWSVTSKCENMN